MENLVHRVYAVPTARKLATAIVASLFALAAIYSLATTRWRELSQGETRVWLAILLTTLAIAAHYLAKAWRWQRCAVEVDPDGLWLQRQGRQALVRWEEIAATSDHGFVERLDLMDAGGKPRLGIHHKLELYDQLVDLVARRMPAPNLAGRLPATFHLPVVYYVIWAAALLAAGYVFSLGRGEGSNLGRFGIVAPLVTVLMVVFQAQGAVLRMVVAPVSLTLSILLGRRIVLKHEVESISIQRDPAFRSVRPQVFLRLKDGSWRMLQFSSIDAISLKRFLDAWLAN